ncbi:hypothetical protein CsSME_00011464 [Camellia sinensis var. sinensis]
MRAILHILRSHPSPLSHFNFHFHLSPRFFSSSSSRFHLHQPTFEEALQQHSHHTQHLSTCSHREKPFISLIKSCSRNTHLVQIHAHLLRTSLLQSPIISLAFLTHIALSPSRNLSYSLRFFSQIPKPNISHYNNMIRVYSLSNSPEESFKFYREMRRNGISPDPLSSSFVTKSCIRMNSLLGGLQVHAKILSDGHQSDSLLMTTLMDLYSICQKCDDALKVFDEMSHRDTVAWNVLISCYTRNGRTRDALGVFGTMQSSRCGSQPDDVTCLLVLQACANLGALEFGERVHSFIRVHGYGNALNLCNSLIAMYSRCGCVDKAYEVFKVMPNKDVVSWSAMISGLASNGHGREAIEAFREMQRMGIVPDDQTFTGVLSACSHSGLVDEGWMFFNSMSKEFRIMPNVHHYGCMVDLLGRAGLLNQAYDLILSMAVKPDATMWRTLLGACRIHCHVTLGERIIEHLIELKAQEAGDYILLLNIYSSVDDWEKVIEVRKLMKEKGIQTTPGCSTVELKGVVHEFVVDDISHPRKNEIYEMLDEIGMQLKIGGYIAEVTSELHNLGADKKETILSYHSEKLAIAFGVLATPPGTTIRVAKNLRTCVDCHNFAKVLSGVYDREVIIRDRTRFHHFREGRCSCNDYW